MQHNGQETIGVGSLSYLKARSLLEILTMWSFLTKSSLSYQSECASLLDIYLLGCDHGLFDHEIHPVQWALHVVLSEELKIGRATMVPSVGSTDIRKERLLSQDHLRMD